MIFRFPHLVIALCLIMPGAAAAQMSPSEQRGQTFVRANCSTCHAIDKVSASPLKIAPPFRELHRRYPVESLQEALVEGIRTGHVNMPEFRLDPGQATDVISYLKALER
jgi:mono/diheme cytochrome c family protein